MLKFIVLFFLFLLGTISGKPGVHHISVSLEKKEASVKFDPIVVSASEITEFIDDMGFEAKLLSGGGDSAPSGNIFKKSFTYNCTSTSFFLIFSDLIIAYLSYW